jgi:hypothetical protein
VTISKLAELYEGEEARNARVRASREKRDAAHREYERTRRVLARLEGRESRHKGGGADERRLEIARADVHRARLAWQLAHRELIRSI